MHASGLELLLEDCCSLHNAQSGPVQNLLADAVLLLLLDDLDAGQLAKTFTQDTYMLILWDAKLYDYPTRPTHV